MNDRHRARFDRLLEEVIEALPERIARLLDEVPVIVEDLPGDDILADLGMPRDEADELCGLHTGEAFTERGVEGTGPFPSEIRLFREGIVAEAGGWGGADADERVREEVRITLLHEIGHQFGLSEDDLTGLGYD